MSPDVIASQRQVGVHVQDQRRLPRSQAHRNPQEPKGLGLNKIVSSLLVYQEYKKFLFSLALIDVKKSLMGDGSFGVLFQWLKCRLTNVFLKAFHLYHNLTKLTLTIAIHYR